MNLEQLKNIINEYKDKFILKNKTPYKFNQNQILLKEINKKYSKLFKSCSEFIYLIKNYDNLENLHIFCYCGKKNNFYGNNFGFSKYCSYKCMANNSEWQEKQKQTKLNDIDKDGLNSYQRMRLKRFNDIDESGLNSYQRAALKQKQTKLNDVDENGNNNYQRSARRGVVTKLNDIDEYGNNNYQRAGTKNKQTKLNNIDENGLNSYQRSEIKRFETMKKNNSFNKSEGEEKIYKSLLTKFEKEDVLRQYKTELYPFSCDFYIKSLDLYIEYHGTWTHFNKPFKNSIKDIEQLNRWKNKNTKFYDNAIYTWTNLDVRKLETFKKNKLNYKIFYNLDQFKNWFNKICKEKI